MIALTVVITFFAARTSDASGVSVTTVVTFPGVAREFDYEAGRVAWIDSAWALRVRVVRTGAQQKFLYTNPYEEIPAFSSRRRLVLEQRRLLWLSTRGLGSRGLADHADHVYLGDVERLRGRRVARYVHFGGLDGSSVNGVAGDSTGFSYGVVTVRETAPDSRRYRVTGGAVWSVIDGRPRLVPDTPPAIVLGRAAGRVAIAPLDTSERRSGVPVAAGPVEIRNATSGVLVSSFSPGPVRAFALSRVSRQC